MTEPHDLRLRIVAVFAVIVCLSALRSPLVAALALVAVLIAAGLSGPRALPWHRLLHLEAFLILLFATLPFTVAGQPLFTLGPLTATHEGVRRAVLILCKVSASALILAALLGDVEPARLGAALRGLRVPETMVRLFVMTVRYLGLLRDEARRLHEAMRARGFRAGSNRNTWRAYGNLIGMLLVRALDRAERVEEAMRCRGYDGHFPHLATPRPTGRDWTGFAMLLGFGLLVTGIDRL